MAELTRDDEDDKVTAYSDAITTWVDSAGGRDLDRMAKGQLRDVAARLSFATSKGRDELRLPRRTRAKGDIILVATRPTPDVPRSWIRWRARSVSTVVLPEPAGAMMRAPAPPCTTAAS